MDVGDPAVGNPGLRAVECPGVSRLVVDRTGPERRDITSRIRFGDTKGGEFGVVGAAKALGNPLICLFRRLVVG